MPEEKVKQYECLCPCEHETGCIACENGNHDYHIVPPAADAGPRQPCAVCGWPLADSVAKGCRPGNCSLRPLPLTAYDPQRANNEYGGLKLWAAAPPAPQEAAPHSKKCAEQLYSSMDAKCICGSDTVQATAPDSAMRVAERITQSGYLRTADIAALIREAGSERERRLTSVLFVIMSDMPKKRDWLDPDIEREASRLLGESK